jgi:hypothetical protein
MDENILTAFVKFLEKSATVVGGTSPSPVVENNVQSGSSSPREVKVDTVNNTQAPGVSNPSHGGAAGMPLTAAPLKKAPWNKPATNSLTPTNLTRTTTAKF